MGWLTWKYLKANPNDLVCFFFNKKDTSSIIHIRFWCIKVRMKAEEFRDKRKGQVWMMTPKVLHAPEK